MMVLSGVLKHNVYYVLCACLATSSKNIYFPIQCVIFTFFFFVFSKEKMNNGRIIFRRIL